MDTSFGILLRRHRRAAGLTQEALAERAGLSGQAVGALERGDRRFPHRDTIRLLADALGLTADGRAEFTAAAARKPKPRNTAPQNGVSPESLAPRHLPPPVARFTGRESQAKTLIELLKGSSTVVVLAIAGMGGVGKTALAVHVGHQVTRWFPDGQLYLDLRGEDTPLLVPEMLGRMMRAIGVTDNTIPVDVVETAARFRSALAGRRVLLVLDNAANADQVLPLLPATPGCAAIITSRSTLTALPPAHHLRLDVLCEQEAIHLFAATAGHARVDAEPEAASAVVRHCGYLPLAIHLAGARLAARPTWPITHLAQRLADEHQRLSELELDNVGVRASFAVSLDHLDPGTALAYALLALPDGPDVTTPIAARLLDRSERAAERLLERLTDLHLLEATTPGRYQFHDLLRAYARERATDSITPSHRTAALRRVVDLLVAAAWRSLALVVSNSLRQAWADQCWAEGGPDFATSADAFTWLDEHRQHLVAVTRTPGIPPELFIRLSSGLFAFYLSRGHWLDWSQVSRAALDASDTASDPLGRAIVRMDLGIALADHAHAWSGSYDEALTHLERSLAEFRSLGHQSGIAACLTNTSEVLEMRGDLHTAISHAGESLAICHELAHPPGEAAAHEYLGSLYGKIGKTELELAHYHASLRLNEQLGHHLDSANVLRRIGAAHRRAGRDHEGCVALRRSRSLCREVSDPAGEAATLEELGRLHIDLGDHDAALELLHDGLALAENYDDLRRRANILRLLGTTLSAVGRQHEADTHWHESLILYEQQGSATADELRALLDGAHADVSTDE